MGSETRSTSGLLLTMLAVASVAALFTALITKSFFTTSCADRTLSFPQHQPDWDMVNKLDVPEKGLRVTRLMSSERCYIMPKRSQEQEKNRAEGRPLAVIDNALSPEMVEQIAGAEAAAFCQGYTTYMLKDISEDIVETGRSKRDAPPPIAAPAQTAVVRGDASPPPPPAAPAGLSSADLAAKVPQLVGPRVEGSGIFGGAALPGKSAAAIPLEQRQPRCHKIVLDCPNMVGQVQSCYTWQNGRIWLDRQCKDPNTFVIRMTKPPGRILKVAQQESILCLQLHRQNKDC